jgi:3D (Asp-Asp-Asp) domain-containing protein
MDIKQLSSPACSPQYTMTIPKETRVRLPVPGAAVVDDTAKVIGTNAQDLTLLCLD